jgi:betaine-aldehyde dehydrogenase
VQALGQELPQLSPVLHISTVSAAGVFSMKVMSRSNGSNSAPAPVSTLATAVRCEVPWTFRPTLFADVSNDMTIAQDEIFGPVVCVIPYDDVDEAVTIANDTPYGLHGGVFTADPARGVEIARRLVTGTVSVNSCTINTDAPFGGRKCSGIGRENGIEGIGAFLEHKTINVTEDIARAAAATAD